MTKEKNVQFNISIPRTDKDLLTRLAARKTWENPGERVTASSLGREILCDYLATIQQEVRETDNP